MIPAFDFLFLIRVSAIWGLLLLFYFLALGKNDNWPLKRYFLLSIYILGLVFPLLPTVYQHTAVENYAFGNQIVANPFVVGPSLEGTEAQAAAFWTWQKVLIGTYLAICLGLALRVLRSFSLLRYWRATGEKSSFQGYQVVQHANIKTPIAGFNTIFLPLYNGDCRDAMNRVSTEMACLHEKLHLQHGHQWERLPLLLGHIFLWFHPLQWLFQHLQEQVQEYEVDEGVLQRFSLPQYGKLLIQASMAPTMAWHPNLFSSPLKNRIDMMCKTKNKQSWRFYHTIALSLLLGFIVVSCTDIVDSNALEQTVIYSAEEIDQPAHSADYELDLDNPHQNIFHAVGRNIKYPKVARANGVEGTVVSAYTINANGEIEDFRFYSRALKNNLREGTVLEEVVIIGYGDSVESNPNKTEFTPEEIDARMVSLQEEVKRILTEFNWSPALKDGKPVATRQILPIRFRLQ